MTNKAISYIRSTEEPWFVAMGYVRPHISNAIPEGAKNLEIDGPNTTLFVSKNNLNYFECSDIGNRKMKFNGNLETMLSKNRPMTSSIAEKFYSDTILFIKWYYSAILFIDSQINRIIKNLEEMKIYDNTVIIFFSDHGWNSGHHGMWCKNNLNENVVNVPLIIRNGLKDSLNHLKDSSNHFPVSLLDIFPTILDIIDEKIPEDFSKLSGKSLMSPMSFVGDFFAFSQYPRCNAYGSIQTSDCMTDLSLPIKFMGYSVRHRNGFDLYSFTLWKSFKKKTDWNSESLDILLQKNGLVIKNKSLEKFYEEVIIERFN